MDKALHVGINKYPTAPLTGCVNDSSDFADYLNTKMKFRADDIRLLCDERATTAAIFDRLRWLVDVTPGSRCFFHYSGHGAQYPSRNYKHELDRLLEVICPVDFDWTPEHMITDKQFVEIFSAIPAGVKFNWISDSCHSGDLTRNMPMSRELAEQTPSSVVGINSGSMLPKVYPMPVDIAWRLRGAAPRTFVGTRAISHGTLDVGFVSGCKSNQTSMDAVFDGRPGGALTQMFLRVLKQKGWGCRLSELTKLTAGALRRKGFTQVPQCEGARAKKPFLG
ncbi:caspase family protein [Candidatus Magnetobacterium casense]|uniref:Caspase family protein n=1 Tax=Candidatus Magnetobacterium casense TaxID=1455061 RepID=A0ABS6S3Y6_9BACT|nr:caspase family protein [Candidatus Magnetobacterium casensis]MBV6343551.1 caspase family protein [Candidatus Magnetobacterium casensis]